MNQFTYGSRMPGSDGALAADEFEPGEIAGMRAAGWVLLATAAITILGWLLQRTGLGPLTALIDIFLGVQLLRLHHSWRAWAMVRAALGVIIGLAMVVGGLAALSIGVAVLGLAQLAYCASLFLFLYGQPSVRRVFAGWAVFAMAVLLMLGGVVLLVLQATIAARAHPA